MYTSRRSEMLQNNIDVIETCRAKKGQSGNVSEDQAYHFIAYVPADGTVWELDGLKRHPVRLGEFYNPGHRCRFSKYLSYCRFPGSYHSGTADWLSVVTPKIQARMMRYSDTEVTFTLLAIVQKPLNVLEEKLRINELLRAEVEAKLATCDATKLREPDDDGSLTHFLACILKVN